MKSFWNNYKSSLILLGAIILGGIVGFAAAVKAKVKSRGRSCFRSLIGKVLLSAFSGGRAPTFRRKKREGERCR